MSAPPLVVVPLMSSIVTSSCCDGPVKNIYYIPETLEFPHKGAPHFIFHMAISGRYVAHNSRQPRI